MTGRRWARYVALGDSSTEGLDDPDPTGGFRGWADRLAEHLAAHQSGVEYANLAIRGRLTAQILAEQLPVALAYKPDLATVLAGMNDLFQPGFNPVAVAADIEAMHRALIAAGATVLTLTLPDPTPNLPLTRLMQPRLANFNDELRLAAERAGAVMVDVAAFAGGSDPRFWSEDRLHGNSDGHERVAHALAHGLGLPGFDERWQDPLPPAAPLPLTDGLRSGVFWAYEHAVPWLWRTVRGRSLGDGLRPKRPEPSPVSEP